MQKNLENYESGFVDSYWKWQGRYANKSYEYFGRHEQGRPIQYRFNSLGYRGPEHHDNPDISVFGSSFSFGVGIDYDQCWHQHLGNYRVNCYASAGFVATNNDIIEHYLRTPISSGKVILQLREFNYNTAPVVVPDNLLCFVIDSYKHDDLLGFTWSGFLDKAEDQTHPGPKTHKTWAYIIKNKFNL